tara:strand:+ start:808 stop:1317 length:510 start_codon:yes stop_codon:yes gene_type:complete
MDQETDKNLEFSNKLKLFFIKQKIKIILIFFTFILISIIFLAMRTLQERENILISEKFIKANIYLSSQNKDKSKELYEEIIKSKNKFYSILALNTILEKGLENNEDVIINYFDILQDLSISPEQKDLLIFKKALYLIKISKTEEGKSLLRKLSNSESYLKNISDQILEN